MNNPTPVADAVNRHAISQMYKITVKQHQVSAIKKYFYSMFYDLSPTGQ